MMKGTIFRDMLDNDDDDDDEDDSNPTVDIITLNCLGFGPLIIGILYSLGLTAVRSTSFVSKRLTR